MEASERRKHRRLRLHVPVFCGLGGSDQPLQTSNISPGGMYVRVPREGCPDLGDSLEFELLIPPGEGYSPSEGKVRGVGKILRVDRLPQGLAGLAVKFTYPLSLRF